MAAAIWSCLPSLDHHQIRVVVRLVQNTCAVDASTWPSVVGHDRYSVASLDVIADSRSEEAPTPVECCPSRDQRCAADSGLRDLP